MRGRGAIQRPETGQQKQSAAAPRMLALTMRGEALLPLRRADRRAATPSGYLCSENVEGCKEAGRIIGRFKQGCSKPPTKMQRRHRPRWRRCSSQSHNLLFYCMADMIGLPIIARPTILSARIYEPRRCRKRSRYCCGEVARRGKARLRGNSRNARVTNAGRPLTSRYENEKIRARSLSQSRQQYPPREVEVCGPMVVAARIRVGDFHPLAPCEIDFLSACVEHDA
jgi:hypothetical protein